MKKMIIVSLMMVLVLSLSLAQLGIKGGMNIGTAGGDDKAINPAMFNPLLSGFPGIQPTARTGLTGGISYKVGLILGLSIQPEVLYTQKGAIYEMSFPGVSGKGTFKLDYIDIPIVVRYAPLPIPFVHPYLEAGVEYSTLLAAKFKAEDQTETNETDIKDHLTKSDFSILLGVGVEVLMFDINARYVMGQTKLFNENDPTTPLNESDLKMYNRAFVITAGLRF
jgi:hypothetical protein